LLCYITLDQLYVQGKISVGVTIVWSTLLKTLIFRSVVVISILYDIL